VEPAQRQNPFTVGRFPWPGVLLVGALVFLNLYDVMYHLITEQTLSLHQRLEAVMVALITAFTIFLLIRHKRILHRAGEQMEQIRAEAEKTADELRRYRQENRNTLEMLRRAMNDQFSRWHFSPEEQRVARLIIQGLSFREIAARMNKSEKTIRNQSLSIYEKSGMTGRNDLAAFFLLDILDIDE
jgi:DNA-binding CsgD family transcriptional regulator/large-conductance mechanosensitive channel